jgi:hypothetical protein
MTVGKMHEGSLYSFIFRFQAKTLKYCEIFPDLSFAKCSGVGGRIVNILGRFGRLRLRARGEAPRNWRCHANAKRHAQMDRIFMEETAFFVAFARRE